jgi:sulfofructose kinase
MAPSPDPRPLVICLGNVVADHTFRVDAIPQPPSKSIARSYALGPGGMAANAAIAVVRLGGRVAFWGRIGDDLNGRPLASSLEAEGVDVSGLRLLPGGRTPVSAVLVDQLGERSILNFRGEHLDPDPAWLPLDRIGEARALLTDPRWPDGARLALAEARRRGLPTVMDGERSETRLLLDLVPRVDHVVFSVPGLQNFAPGKGPAAALRQAMESGPLTLAAVTQGEKPTLWMLRGDAAPRRTPAFPVIATNTTGAGDVFHGAYALAIAEGQAPAQAIRFASAAGALRAQEGETPRRAAVEALLAGKAGA